MAVATARRKAGTSAGEDRPANGCNPAAIHAQAQQIAQAHAGAEAIAAGPAFRQRLLELARSGAQRATIAVQGGDIEHRARAGCMRIFADGAPADILFDLARPLASLIAEGRRGEANMLANRYFDLCPQGARGWGLLPLMIALHTEDVAAADMLLAPVAPRLIALGGLSGTGKSSLARLLGGHIGRAPGARVVRSDVFRKRLQGIPPESRLPASHYTRRHDAETYEAMFESADDHIACGTTVIFDAVFLSRSEREVAAALARQARAAFTGIWLEAPERDRIARIAARIDDASDATVDVAREQSRRSVGDLFGWHRLRANRPMETILPAARAMIENTRHPA